MTGYRNGGAAVVETLAAHGVDTIFGIPGTHNLELYRHFPAAGVRAVTPRHEQGAGYAAEAYARVTGRPGVVVATSGPGLTNTMTAAATAYAESQPMLILSSGMPTGKEGLDLGQLHEAKNTSAAMDQLVRWSRRVRTADEAAAAVTDAFESFTGGRPRAGARRSSGRRAGAAVVG
jgi:acetolactate synthase-1/2/3 large subunit